MSPEEETTLMMLFDGELDPTRRRAALKLLNQSDEALEFFSALGRSQAAVLAWQRATHPQVNLTDSIIDRVSTADNRPAASLPKTSVKAPKAPSGRGPIGFKKWAVDALAVAAMSAMFVLASLAEGIGDRAGASVEFTVDQAASIQNVDFGERSGSIFLVSSGDFATPVVWVVDDAEGTHTGPGTL